MLTADEYHARYYSHDTRALQLAKYYLGRWGFIERNASRLSEHYQEVAYILFSALNEMTEEEREFLANKYRVTIFMQQSKNDKELFEEYDVTLYRYRLIRKGVEYKFYHHLKPLIKEHKGENFLFTS